MDNAGSLLSTFGFRDNIMSLLATFRFRDNIMGIDLICTSSELIERNIRFRVISIFEALWTRTEDEWREPAPLIQGISNRHKFKSYIQLLRNRAFGVFASKLLSYILCCTPDFSTLLHRKQSSNRLLVGAPDPIFLHPIAIWDNLIYRAALTIYSVQRLPTLLT